MMQWIFLVQVDIFHSLLSVHFNLLVICASFYLELQKEPCLLQKHVHQETEKETGSFIHNFTDVKFLYGG